MTGTTNIIRPQDTSLPATASEWEPLVEAFLGERGWEHVQVEATARIIGEEMGRVNNLRDVTADGIEVTVCARMAREAGHTPRVNDGYVSGWLMRMIVEAIEEAGEDGGQAPVVEGGEDKPARLARLRTHIENLFLDLAPHVWLFMSSPQEKAAALDVMAYQAERWDRGVGRVDGVHEALAQYNRRCNRLSLPQMPPGAVMTVHGALLHERGEVTSAPTRVPMTEADAQSILRREGVVVIAIAIYYAALALAYAVRRSVQGSESPVAALVRASLESNISQVTVRDNEDVVESIALIAESIIERKHKAASPAVEVDTIDGLIEWQKSLHPDAGDLQIQAIEKGLATWYDTVRYRPDEVRVDVVGSARRWVKAFGFTRFSGKAPRRALETVLGRVAEAHYGESLTAEEWLQYMERFRTAVAYVSGRNGEQHSMCSQLEAATAELGIDTVRKPKHKVRFKGCGIVVEVEIETWFDGQDAIDHAQQRWHEMSDEEKEASVVSRTGLYVNWSDMGLAR